MFTRFLNIRYEKNNIHLTRYAFCQKGGLFDQMPVKKGQGQIPLKKGMDITKYGGYNKASASFFVVAKYLYNKYPNRNEGDYTLVRADVVDTNSLSREVAELGLMDFLLVDQGFTKQDVSFKKNKKIYA